MSERFQASISSGLGPGFFRTKMCSAYKISFLHHCGRVCNAAKETLEPLITDYIFNLFDSQAATRTLVSRINTKMVLVHSILQKI